MSGIFLIHVNFNILNFIHLFICKLVYPPHFSFIHINRAVSKPHQKHPRFRLHVLEPNTHMSELFKRQTFMCGLLR